MHRVDDAPVRARALRCYQRLGEHLPSEHPAVGLPEARTGEDVLTRAGTGVGEVERCEEAGQGVAHAL